MIHIYWKKKFWIFCHGIQETFYGMCVTSVLFRSDDEDEDDDEGGEGSCEQQQEQPTLRKSVYVKQIGKFWQQIPWDMYYEQDVN